MLLVVSARALADGPGPWKFVRDDDGIVVYRRTVEGSSLDEARANGVVEAPLAAVLAVLEDADRGTEWMAHCVGAKIVERIDDHTRIVYNRTHLPWPLADRDALVRGTRTFAAHEVRVEFTSTEDSRMPPVRGVTRMSVLRGRWILTPERKGQATRVEYQVLADPGGALPGWIVNWFSKSLPYETIENLRAQVKRRRYPEVEQELSALPEYQAIVGTP
jgi:hypothetical protein